MLKTIHGDPALPTGCSFAGYSALIQKYGLSVPVYFPQSILKNKNQNNSYPIRPTNPQTLC